MSVAEQLNVNFLDPDLLADPYPTYKTMRDSAPVYFEQTLNAYIVTRYDLLREIIRDTETYSSKYDQFLNLSRQMAFDASPKDVQEKLIAIDHEMVDVPPTMLTLDTPEHTKYRSLVSKLFTVTNVKSMQPHVDTIIQETVDRFVEHGSPADFMATFAFPVPLRIIADRLGIPEEDRDFFDDAATAAASGLRMSPLTPDEMVKRAQMALDLQKLLVRLTEARRTDPRDDMITILANSKLEDEDRYLTHGETISILNQFLVAGHETTASSFGWGMYALCRQPELQDELRGHEDHIKTFCEEALRVDAPVAALPRLVTKDAELGGVKLKAGDIVMLNYAAANRDERQFEDPELIDLERSKTGLHLAFGSGVHHCIGAPLARQELNLGWMRLLDRCKNFRLAEGFPAPKAEPSLILRALPYIHVEFDKI